MPDNWTIGGRVFDPALVVSAADIAPHAVWGIINATPDSFYDGGVHFSLEKALSHADSLVEDGAAVLDIGGASSRPGAADVPVEEELSRIMPLVRELKRRRPAAGAGLCPPLSVDTWRAAVAEAVLHAGADIINDISACAWEPDLISVVAGFKPGYVLMHSRGRPGLMQMNPVYDDVVSEILAFFESHMNRLVRAGLPESNILLDPGIGFGKSLLHNLAILGNLDRLRSLGRPLLLGLSNKALFGDLFGLPPGRRETPTAVCAALAAHTGVRHHRVHNVKSCVQALALANVFMNGEGRDRSGDPPQTSG